jgi:pimeloyl-ACP methyl ester carboxylesterase
VTVTTINDALLDGAFACPETDVRPRAVLALGGSDGGVPKYFLHLLAAERFACLALAYWGTGKTQPALVEMPLERIERALHWLRDHPKVATRDGRVAVVGASKGAELALVLATTFPDLVGPVVAYTPSSVVWSGIDFSAPGAPLRSTWARAGKALPFVPVPPVPPAQSERGMSFLPIYDRGLDGVAADNPAVIPIERSAEPVLLISGGDDRVWPASRMSRMVVDRARRFGREHLVQQLDFPEAGHALFPVDPDSDLKSPMPVDLGGSESATARAHAVAWPQVVRVISGAG